jgi:hypothetical protein
LSNELTDMHALRGYEAVEALSSYAQNLESNQREDLTQPQRDFLIKAAKILSQTITTSPECKQKKSPRRRGSLTC